MIRALAFLGNFGSEYQGTRHNVAWNFLDFLPFEKKLSWQKKFKAEFCAVEKQFLRDFFWDNEFSKDQTFKSEKIFLLKPQTYMNLSGESLIQAATFFKILPNEILVLHDEIELSLGFFSFKFGGGLGGHNGLRSVKANLGTADFFRLRFGISKPQKDVASYVLQKFSIKELSVLGLVFESAKNALKEILFCENPENLVQKYSKVKVCDEKI